MRMQFLNLDQDVPAGDHLSEVSLEEEHLMASEASDAFNAAETALADSERVIAISDSLEDLAARIDATDLDVTADDFLVLQNAGPTSDAAMPEAGYIPIPTKLARQGVKDMVRISDARMSGTAYGTIILHVAPDAASGGPLSLVRNGDRMRLSVSQRRFDLLVDEAELEERRRATPVKEKTEARGYQRIYNESILQADEGCDFSFLQALKKPAQ